MTHEAVLQVNGVPTGKTRVVVMLPDRFEYVAGSVTVDGARATDKAEQLIGAGEQVLSVNDGVITVRLGELAPGTVRTVRFATHAPASAGGTLPVRAFAIFDTPAKSGVRTQQIESQLSRGAARFGRSQFTFTPRFDVLKTELSPADEERAARPDPQLARRARHHHSRRGSHGLAADSPPQSRSVSRTTTRCRAPARRR